MNLIESMIHKSMKTLNIFHDLNTPLPTEQHNKKSSNLTQDHILTQQRYTKFIYYLFLFGSISCFSSYCFVKKRNIYEKLVAEGTHSTTFTSWIKSILLIFISLTLVDRILPNFIHNIRKKYFKKSVLELELPIITTFLNCFYVLFYVLYFYCGIKKYNIISKDTFMGNILTYIEGTSNFFLPFTHIIRKWTSTVLSLISELSASMNILCLYILFNNYIKHKNKYVKNLDSKEEYKKLSHFNAISQFVTSIIMFVMEIIIIFLPNKFITWTRWNTIMEIIILLLLFSLQAIYWLIIYILNTKCNYFFYEKYVQKIEQSSSIIEDVFKLSTQPMVMILFYSTIFYFIISCMVRSSYLDLQRSSAKQSEIIDRIKNFITQYSKGGMNPNSYKDHIASSQDEYCQAIFHSFFLNVNNLITGIMCLISSYYKKKNRENTYIHKQFKIFFYFILCSIIGLIVTIFTLLVPTDFILSSRKHIFSILLFFNIWQPAQRTIKYMLFDSLKENIFHNIENSSEYKTVYERLSSGVGRIIGEVSIFFCQKELPNQWLNYLRASDTTHGVISWNTEIILLILLFIFYVILHNKHNYEIIKYFEMFTLDNKHKQTNSEYKK